MSYARAPLGQTVSSTTATTAALGTGALGLGTGAIGGLIVGFLAGYYFCDAGWEQRLRQNRRRK